MKSTLYILLLIILHFSSYAQQSEITKEVCDNWKLLHGNENISNNGKFITYKYGSNSTKEVLVVSSIDRKYVKEILGGSNATFTPDGNFLFAQIHEDTLMQLNLKDYSVHYFPNVTYYCMPTNHTCKWIGYLIEKPVKKLVLKNISSGEQKEYVGVNKFNFINKGQGLLLQMDFKMLYLNLKNGGQNIVSSITPVSDVIFDESETKLAFITSRLGAWQINYYQIGMDSAEVHDTDDSDELSGKYSIVESPIQFSPNGELIYFKVAPKKLNNDLNRASVSISDDVTVWSYKDKFIQSQQKANLAIETNISYAAVTNVKKKRIIILESEIESVFGEYRNNKYILSSKKINTRESYWNHDTIEYFITCLRTGNHKSIKKGPDSTLILPILSPSEKFVLWFDLEAGGLYSFETSSGLLRNLTQNIKPYIYESVPGNISKYIAYDRINWLANDETFLVSDRFDIWKIDPSNKNVPLNITNGFGRKNKVTFHYLNQVKPISNNPNRIVLSGLNTNNMDNGFWTVDLGAKKDPDSLSMGPYIYFSPSLQQDQPVKAKNNSIYILRRMSAKDAPNLFLTSDFKSFTPITDIQPQKSYLWFSSTLVHWVMPNGHHSKGILYKPDNFDLQKKYPLIITYYEQRSDELNLYLEPKLQIGRINIPWYLSRGYLVFIPDIYYIKGHNGIGIVNSVVSAVSHLTNFPWIDKHKLGLQGHSFGGFETNFLITHTNMFAAAQEAAGQSNLISGYGGLGYLDGLNRQNLYERGQSNMGCPPWECPDLYIENSPVLSVNHVITPLLMVHNKEDNAVPYSQAIEFFTSLRRAGKKVWLLEYENEGHIVTSAKNKLDLTIRTQQFFDHYLKDMLPPFWMSKGVDFKHKKVNSGLELDSSNATP